MALTISKVDTQLEYQRTPSKLDIETRNANLELHQKQAKVNIHTELPKVIIDQYECFASAGLKGNYDFTREAAQRGYQQVLDFIGQNAQDGGMLAAIERGGNPIAVIAKRDSSPMHEFGLDFIPKVGPKIDVVGDIKFDPERNSEGINNGVEGTYNPGAVNINYTPVNLSIYVKQYPSISIDYTGNTIDTMV